MKTLEEMVKEREDYLLKQRGTGRTTAMLREALSSFLSSQPNENHLILAHSEDYSRDLMFKCVEIIEKIPNTLECVNKSSRCIKLKNNSTLTFRSKEYSKSPYFRYMNWDKISEDHRIYDIISEKIIEQMKQELLK